jgi:hypothetical protein
LPPRLRLPSLVETALAVLLLDYTLYIWHVLTHKVPLLWRLHRVHHSDLDLTDSNWGTIFSLPDYLHRTVRLNVPQQACPSRSSARAGGSGLRAEARPSRTVAGERLAAHRMTGTMALWRAADLCSRRSSIAARLTRAMPRCMQDSFRAA